MVSNEFLQTEDPVVNEIVTCARVLFEKFGLRKTTMEDIARELGKGKSSLYYYFPGKQEIFEAVMNREIEELSRLAARAVEKASLARDKLKAYCKVRLNKVGKLGNLSQLVKNDLMDNMDVVMRLKKKHESKQLNMIRGIIQEGVATGEFKKIEERDIDLLAVLFTATFTGLSLPLCSDYQIPELSQRVDVIVDVMVEGIGNN